MESQHNMVFLQPLRSIRANITLALALFLLANVQTILVNGDNLKLKDAFNNQSLLDTAPIFPPSASTSQPKTDGPFGNPSDVDDVNGDDGQQLKKDFEVINKTLNETGKEKHQDTHQYYQPEYITDPDRAMSFWLDFSKLAPNNQSTSYKHDMLSKSYRRAAPIRLTFEFPFYGQPMHNIIMATGGFLYLGDHIHHWLAATQNISPLMANFDLSKSNFSDIYHYDNGTAFVAQWHEVQMKDEKPPGNFSFQVTLFKNGDIVFVYKSLPVSIHEIPEVEHPVKVGISDAFLIDKVAFFIRRKTIYDYHRMNLKDVPELKSKSAIYLKALPTCNQYDTCDSCANSSPTLECVWCHSVKRCSSGFDRKRQEWLTNSCDKIQKSVCTIKTDSKEVQTGSSGSSSVIPSESESSRGLSLDPSTPGRHMPLIPDRESSGTAFISFLMFLALTSGIALWTFYAYRNPHTPSGQMLIKYRPSNWRWQNADARYTAASIHM